MPVQSGLKRALAALEASAFEANADLARTHEIAELHEGAPVFDALQAFCHRIEGDVGNAAYWDRQAGTAFGGTAFGGTGHAAEFAALKAFAKAQT